MSEKIAITNDWDRNLSNLDRASKVCDAVNADYKGLDDDGPEVSVRALDKFDFGLTSHSTLNSSGDVLGV